MSLFLVWNIERNMWWLGNRRGYTHNAFLAGHYTEETAYDICSEGNFVDLEDIMVPINFLPSMGRMAAEKMMEKTENMYT